MPKITPWLWFESQAEEAATHYTSLFKDSRIVNVARFGDGGRGEPGAVMMVAFELSGQPYVALNGAPQSAFTAAVSLQIDCADQAEIDYYWDGLLVGGGEPSRCGWLKDKFGVSWQVTPSRMGEFLGHPDPDKARRAMAAMMKMTKIDLTEMERATQ